MYPSTCHAREIQPQREKCIAKPTCSSKDAHLRNFEWENMAESGVATMVLYRNVFMGCFCFNKRNTNALISVNKRLVG